MHPLVLAGLSEWVRDAVDAGGYLALAGLILIENLFPPIPSELILPLAGYYVQEGTLAFLPAVFFATLGSVVGALILYYVAKAGGRPLLLHYGRYLRFTHKDLDKADYWFDKHGHWIVLFGRLVPGLRSIVSIPAGLSEMPITRFIALTTLGSAVWNSALIGIGWQLGANFDEVERFVGPASRVVLVLFIVGVVGSYVWWRRRTKRQPVDEVAFEDASV